MKRATFSQLMLGTVFLSGLMAADAMAVAAKTTEQERPAASKATTQTTPKTIADLELSTTRQPRDLFFDMNGDLRYPNGAKVPVSADLSGQSVFVTPTQFGDEQRLSRALQNSNVTVDGLGAEKVGELANRFRQSSSSTASNNPEARQISLAQPGERYDLFLDSGGTLRDANGLKVAADSDISGKKIYLSPNQIASEDALKTALAQNKLEINGRRPSDVGGVIADATKTREAYLKAQAAESKRSTSATPNSAIPDLADLQKRNPGFDLSRITQGTDGNFYDKNNKKLPSSVQRDLNRAVQETVRNMAKLDDVYFDGRQFVDAGGKAFANQADVRRAYNQALSDYRQVSQLVNNPTQLASNVGNGVLRSALSSLNNSPVGRAINTANAATNAVTRVTSPYYGFYPKEYVEKLADGTFKRISIPFGTGNISLSQGIDLANGLANNPVGTALNVAKQVSPEVRQAMNAANQAQNLANGLATNPTGTALNVAKQVSPEVRQGLNTVNQVNNLANGLATNPTGTALNVAKQVSPEVRQVSQIASSSQRAVQLATNASSYDLFIDGSGALRTNTGRLVDATDDISGKVLRLNSDQAANQDYVKQVLTKNEVTVQKEAAPSRQAAAATTSNYQPTRELRSPFQNAPVPEVRGKASESAYASVNQATVHNNNPFVKEGTIAPVRSGFGNLAPREKFTD